MTRTIKKSAMIIVGSLLFSGSLFAKEETITLTLHHFLSSKSPAHSQFLVPWAKKLEKASKGKIKVEIFPSMSMGGKPNELYKQARDGVSDMVWTVAGYSPGVFPRTEVYELPTVHLGDAVATSIAMKKNFDLIKDDYKKVKPLLVYVPVGSSLHMVEKKVTKISDLKGLKLRSPSRTGAWYIEELGAEATGMPIPSVPQSLAKNAIDGAILPFELFPAFKFQQLTKYSTIGKNGERFGTSVLMVLMNQDKFDSLSKELQDIIEENTGIPMIKTVSQLWTDNEEVGINLQKSSKGGEVLLLSAEETKKLNIAGEKVVQRWVKEINGKGMNGQEIVDSARESIRNNTK